MSQHVYMQCKKNRFLTFVSFKIRLVQLPQEPWRTFYQINFQCYTDSLLRLQRLQTALKGIPTQPLNSARACKYRMLVNVRLVGTFSNFLFYGRCDYCKEPFEISLEVRSCGQWNLWFLGLKKPVAVGEIYLVLSTQGAKKAKTSLL